MTSAPLRLGVNIDHVATIRNARKGVHPDPVKAAIMAAEAGADGITAHLREDRRHISDDDIYHLKESISLPLNLEIAATDEMLRIALKAKPNAACIVPEKRQEVTTEGGLNVIAHYSLLEKYVKELAGAGIRVSLFIDADKAQVEAAANIGATIVEFHTGSYAHVEPGKQKSVELQKIVQAVFLADSLGLECHAGHGLTYDNVEEIASIHLLKELNIGHFLVGEAVFLGLGPAIKRMKELMEKARVY